MLLHSKWCLQLATFWNLSCQILLAIAKVLLQLSPHCVEKHEFLCFKHCFCCDSFWGQGENLAIATQDLMLWFFVNSTCFMWTDSSVWTRLAYNTTFTESNHMCFHLQGYPWSYLSFNNQIWILIYTSTLSPEFDFSVVSRCFKYYRLFATPSISKCNLF